jgi:hypothetical protein
MRLYAEELALARSYSGEHPFESLTEEQVQQIAERGRLLRNWFRSNGAIHNTISVLVLAFIFLTDYWALLRMPRLLLPAGEAHSLARIAVAAMLAGGIHSYLMYSLGVYSMHEGASHRWIFVGADAWRGARASLPETSLVWRRAIQCTTKCTTCPITRTSAAQPTGSF